MAGERRLRRSLFDVKSMAMLADGGCGAPQQSQSGALPLLEQAAAGCSQWTPLHDAGNADDAPPQFLEYSVADPLGQQSHDTPVEAAQSSSSTGLQPWDTVYAFGKPPSARDSGGTEITSERPRGCPSSPLGTEQDQNAPTTPSILTYRNRGDPTPNLAEDALGENVQDSASPTHVTFPDLIEIILGHIWQFLSFADMAALESTNMRLFEMCESDALWRQIYHHHACSAWRCEGEERHSCDANHRTRQTILLKHKRKGSCRGSNTSVNSEFDYAQDLVDGGALETVAHDHETPPQESCSVVEKMSSFVSKAVRSVRQRWLQSVVQLSGSLGLSGWFRFNETPGPHWRRERALLYVVRRAETMENYGALTPTPCASPNEKKMLLDAEVSTCLPDKTFSLSCSTPASRKEVPLLPVSRFKVMLLEEFASVEQEKLALLNERVALLKDINRFRHELRHLILNFENPSTSSSSFSEPHERLLYLKELLANQPDRTCEIESVTTCVIPRVLTTVRAFHTAIHALRIRAPSYFKGDTTDSIL